MATSRFRHQTAHQKSTDIDWANPKQQQAFAYGPVGAGEGLGGPLIMSGGFGSAKTFALCLKALWLSSTFPNNRGIIFRRKWTELQKTTMSTFFKICPPEAYDPKLGGRRSDSEKYLRLANGSEILWMHMDDPEVEGVIRGIEINWFLGDQMEEIEEEIFDLLMGRLGRWDQAQVPDWLIEQEFEKTGEDWPYMSLQGKPMVPTYAMGACNPDTELHWIYRRFHPESPEWVAPRSMTRMTYDDAGVRQKEDYTSSYKQEGYLMISVASYENKFLPDVNLNEMLKKDEAYRRRYVEGEWGVPEGQIHYIEENSLIPWNPTVVPYLTSTCNLYRFMDHGDSAPTCVGWLAVTRDGDLIFYREYYKGNTLVSEHRRKVWELSQGEEYITDYADPSIYAKVQRQGKEWSVFNEWADVKVLDRRTAIWWQKADNNEFGTRNRINEFLQPVGSGEFEIKDGKRVELPRPHPITKELGFWPRLFFVVKSEKYPYGCDKLIRQTKMQRREKIGTEDGKPIFDDERDDKIVDHGYDVVRYGVASRPASPTEKAHAPGPNTFHGKRMMMKRQKRRQLLRRTKNI